MNTIRVTYGSCIDIDFSFTDENDLPEDITHDTFGILSASSDVFDSAILTKADPENGRLHLYLSSENARRLPAGSANWFRLRRIVAGGCEDNTPPIWMHVT